MSTKIVFLIYCVLVFGACDALRNQGASSSNSLVDIIVSTGGEQGLNKKPLVFLQEREENQICRRGLPNPQQYRFEENCFNLGSDEEADSESGSNTGTTAGSAGAGSANADNQQGTNNNQEGTDTNNLTMKVGPNWFKMGLVITNGSKTEWLIVDSISFNISGKWGDQTLRGQKEIGSPYCSGINPLYIIPPLPTNSSNNQRTGTHYQPAKSNFLNNMTIYIDGVPIPTGPPVRRGAGTSGEDNPASSRGGPDEGGANQPEPETFVLDRLPNYKVKALARGYWINGKCETLHNFEKSFEFSLSSSFQN